MAGLAIDPGPRGIARALGEPRQFAAQGDRHQRHVAQEQECPFALVRQAGNTRADRSGYALLPVCSLDQMAVQPGQRVTDRTTMLADDDQHLIKAPGCHRLGSATDHRHTIERREQLAPAEPPPRACRQDDGAPAGQRH
tara:strand:- start:67693 stop:68109 length:417 start_codon:yes stop_codon:yes gene_type:complete